METQILRIQSTDVILTDYEPGKGKIIISDDNYGYNFSYFWGAMGKGTLKEFLCDIDTGYFTGKLGPHGNGDINMKKTMKAVRRWWKEDSGIAWYQFQEEQKDLRYELRQMEQDVDSEGGFIHAMSSLKDNSLLRSSYKKSDFDFALDSLCSEPWYFIVNDEHRQNKWLSNFHQILKKEIAS